LRRLALAIAALALGAAAPVAAQPRAGDLWLGLGAGRVGVTSFPMEDFSGPDLFEGPCLAVSLERFGHSWWSYGARGSYSRLEADDYDGTLDGSWWGLGVFTRVEPPSTVTVRMTMGVEFAYGEVEDGPESWQQGSTGFSAGIWFGPGFVLDWGQARLSVDGEIGMGPELADTGDIFVGRWLVGVDFALGRGSVPTPP
jgi:hypothetical protein